MKFQKLLFVVLGFWGCLLFSSIQTNAVVSVRNTLEYVSSSHRVRTVSSTYILDYQTSVYYKAGVDAILFDQYGDNDRGFEVNSLSATVHCDVQSTYLSFHRLDVIHFLRSIYVGGPGYYDPYGYSNGKQMPPHSSTDPEKLKSSAKPENNLSGSSANTNVEVTPTNQPQYTSFQDYPIARYIIDGFVAMRPRIDAFSPTGLPVGTGGPILMRFVGVDLSPERRSGYIPRVNVTGTGVTAVARPADIDYTGLNVEVTVAEDAEIGDHQISITLPDLQNGTVTSNQLPFRVGDRSPVITNISGDRGNTGEVLQVIINGRGFGLLNQILIDGGGIGAAIQSQTSTQIVATFAIGDNAPPGDRGVKVKSFGRSGTGFILVPGASDTSNPVPFSVIANPSVTIPEIGSVEKGVVKTVTVNVQNAPAGHITRFRFRNKVPATPCPLTGCETGEARFENGTLQGATEISFNGNGNFDIPIRGWERSSSRNNVKLEARFNNNSDVKRDKSFSVSSVQFTETAECNGFDNVEAIKNNDWTTYLYVPRGGNNTVKAKVIPDGATGNFTLSVQGGNGITVSPSVINSNSEVTVTVSATATADRDLAGIYVKANNSATTTNFAEFLYPLALIRKNKTIKIYKVKEDNDDVQATPVGQGAPNQTAYLILTGPNGVVDTSPQGDDVIGITPYWERPPSQRNNAKIFRIKTGLNGILETPLQGDDGQYIPTSAEEQRLYAPITVIGNGLADAICITRGVNDFLDTKDRDGDDQEIPDPANPSKTVISAGSNGRCQSRANNTDTPASNPPGISAIQDYLNTRWGRQANIFFTVDPNIQEIDVNYDLDRDGKVKTPTNRGTANTEEIDAMKQTQTANTINMYWAGLDFNDLTILGIGQSNHSWFAKNTLLDQPRALYTIAHEIGHSLGRNGHTSEDASALEYQRDLMYAYYLDPPTFNQCRIRREDWDLVNGDQ
jgi:hypothetical protein